jgi:hypothetical protein
VQVPEIEVAEPEDDGQGSDPDSVVEQSEEENPGLFSPVAEIGGQNSPMSGVQQMNPLFEPSEAENLDADCEDAPLRFREMSNLIGPAVQPGRVKRELANSDGDRVFTVSVEEPVSVGQAVREASWRRAMEEELQAIEENHTWTLTELPPGQRAIGLKWVFKVKRDERGSVVRQKARLIVKGYAQRQGVDYDEVFAPVARMEAVRLLLALAAQEGWKVHHMDVKTAFLNEELQEEVFVE